MMEFIDSRYVPPSGNLFNEWVGCETEGYQPTDRQKVLIDAVLDAKANGLFYTKDVLNHVAKALSVTPEQTAVGATRTEGGDFGMDCYYARQFIEARHRHEAERQAWTLLKPAIGMDIGTLVFNDYKRTTGVVVTGFVGDGDVKNGKGMLMALRGKRGSMTVLLNATATQVRYAMDRAAEKGNRKTNFDQFVAVSATKQSQSVCQKDELTGTLL